MKKLFCFLLVASFGLSACIFTSSPIKGLLNTDATLRGSLNLSKLEAPMIEGRATAKGILGFVSGDCSYQAAIKDALEKSGAKGITNIVVDYKVKNTLGIVAEYTTIVRGNPLR